MYLRREHRLRPRREQTYHGRLTLAGVWNREGAVSSVILQNDDLSARPHNLSWGSQAWSTALVC